MFLDLGLITNKSTVSKCRWFTTLLKYLHYAVRTAYKCTEWLQSLPLPYEIYLINLDSRTPTSPKESNVVSISPC